MQLSEVTFEASEEATLRVEVRGASRTRLRAAYVRRCQPLLPVDCPSLKSERVILAVELSRFMADTHTIPGLLERLHNHSLEGLSGCCGDGSSQHRDG